jgi:eukaryotic-like serine/threonine-protein kinase
VQGCPSDEVLFAWALGAQALGDQAAGSEASAGERVHLAQCALCAELVSELVVSLRDAGTQMAGGAQLSLGAAPTELAPLLEAGSSALGAAWGVGALVADRYQIIGLLGRGGMGAVLRAADLQTGKEVALKVLHPQFAQSDELRVRLHREAEVLRKLPAEHVAAPKAVGQLQSGEPYLVMEALVGEDLSQHLERVGKLAPKQARAWWRKIARALASAHEHGIVHRDLKPSNVFVMHNTHALEDEVDLRLLDFGLSKWTVGDLERASQQQVRAPLTRADALMGTPAYMAPEQIRDPRSANKASDVWALGLIYYELLTGKNPFERETLGATLAAVLTDDVDWGMVPQDCRAILTRCLSRDVAARYPGAAQLLAALENKVDAPQPIAAFDTRPSRSGARTLGYAVAALGLGVGGMALRGQLHEKSNLSRSAIEEAPAPVLAARATASSSESVPTTGPTLPTDISSPNASSKPVSPHPAPSGARIPTRATAQAIAKLAGSLQASALPTPLPESAPTEAKKAKAPDPSPTASSNQEAVFGGRR